MSSPRIIVLCRFVPSTSHQLWGLSQLSFSSRFEKKKLVDYLKNVISPRVKTKNLVYRYFVACSLTKSRTEKYWNELKEICKHFAKIFWYFLCPLQSFVFTSHWKDSSFLLYGLFPLKGFKKFWETMSINVSEECRCIIPNLNCRESLDTNTDREPEYCTTHY